MDPSFGDKSFHTVSCETVRLWGINSRFQLLSLSKRQVTHALLTRPPLSFNSLWPKSPLIKFSLDLHVLGTPPAFILSQDQTLDKKMSQTICKTIYACVKSCDILAMTCGNNRRTSMRSIDECTALGMFGVVVDTSTWNALLSTLTLPDVAVVVVTFILLTFASQLISCSFKRLAFVFYSKLLDCLHNRNFRVVNYVSQTSSCCHNFSNRRSKIYEALPSRICELKFTFSSMLFSFHGSKSNARTSVPKFVNAFALFSVGIAPTT